MVKSDQESVPSFAALTNLACSSQGGKVIFASDEWFAPAYRMLQLSPPVWKEGEFTDFGKWMDGWESRRRRTPGHDWCLVELGAPGVVRGVELDTAFFTGNNVPAISIQVCNVPGFQLPKELLISRPEGEGGVCASEDQMRQAEECIKALPWRELLPRAALRPGVEATRHNFFACNDSEPATHLRLNTFPDGGIARFRVYGEVFRDWSQVAIKDCQDFALSKNGGVALAWSNAHYGLPRNCLAPGPSRRMDEGWETARNPERPAVLEVTADGLCDCGYAFDWFVLRLGAQCELQDIELDTSHFKGNYPESCMIEGLDNASVAGLPALEQMEYFSSDASKALHWKPVLQRSRLGPHQTQRFGVAGTGVVTHLRVTIFPDGGLARMRAWGRLKVDRKKPRQETNADLRSQNLVRSPAAASGA